MAETLERNEDLVRIIRAAGLKVTAPRLAALEALQRAPHSSADQILLAVRRHLPGTSAQAIYGVLSAFTEAGLVRRFDPPGTAALFECRVGDNHHHLLCIRCGTVTDVDCVIGAAPCLKPSDDSGFAILTAEVTFNGICPQCRNAS